ncbi:rho GTPase-activating protein 6-like isoform X2 [Pseudophryne corroboree]|uniref:rho GTPase-activating protein 6-like isoform X2 n=1 Tax=Pseudophryne corroboree TaxID=495146 RepID=UPI0030814564
MTRPVLTMRATGPSVVVIQHLKSLGIKLRMPKKTVSPDVQRKTSNGGIFGVPLQSLPLSTEGDVPQFVVDVCQYLSCHLSTEGLFRKSGSVNRIKTLKVQLESGESCFASAQPSDAAALLKQFFRELPQPLLTPELQDPLCQIQQSLCEEEKMTATVLVTCLLPAVHGETLRYFCTFLQSVASRSDENKMDSGNLAVVLTPSLFSSNNLCEKLTLATEKQLQLQTSAVQSLIENAQEIGQLPSFILEKISLPDDATYEDPVILEGLRRRRRRSMSGLVNDAFNKLRSGLGPSNATPDRVSDEMLLPQRSKTKRKASEDSACGEQCTAKKRKSLREAVDEHLSSEESHEPSGTHSPLQDDSAGGEVFSNFSQIPGNFLELESGSIPATPESSSRKKARSKRRNSKRVKRMPSGQVPVTPLLLDRKEKVRNSLRIFQRARAAKQPTPEGKGLEESSWDMMKRMVTEALEGPIFNGKDFRMAALTLRASSSVNAPEANSSPVQHPSSPQLRSSPSWHALATDFEGAEVACSGKQRRVLRRSLSMPETIVDCTKPEGGQEMVHGKGLTTSMEDGIQRDGLNFSEDPYVQVLNSDTQPLMDCLITETSHSIHSHVSVTEMSALQSFQTLRRQNGHTSQYRSVRKLVLSFPWAPSVLDPDPHQKDWEELASHPIKRKGARRFGRSLSQESGLSTNLERHRTNDTDGCSVGNNCTAKFLSGRNRQVFVSRKNITLAHWGHRSLDNEHQASVEEEPTDAKSLLQEPLLNLYRDSSIFKDVVEGQTPPNLGSPKSPIPETSMEPSCDSVDL